jgi:hypothetical protein
MSEFEMDFGEELIEVIAKKLLDEGVDDSHRNIRLFLKDFMDWSDFLLDEDYVEDSATTTESDDSDSEPEVRGVVVEEEYDIEVDDKGFHSLKDCVIKKK